MKKSISLYGLVLASLLLLFTQCLNWKKSDQYDYALTFLSEDYKPLNYIDSARITGLAPSVLAEIADHLNMTCNINIMSWDLAYALALKTDNAVLFSTILNSERKDQFKWAGPFASLDQIFYASANTSLTITSLEDAKAVAKIGVIKDYAIEQYLASQGFTNIRYVVDDEDAFTQLLNGEIDLFPADSYTAKSALTELGKTIYAVTPLLTIKTDLLYFAFNKNVPDKVVSDFQDVIDKIKEDGTLKNLTEYFLNTSDVPGTLQIYTEQYPPLTYRNSFGEITGFGTDIVREIMDRNNNHDDIKLSLWSNGYQLALDNPNVCLFTMDKTDSRTDLFQWVGPIGTNTTWFYTKEGSGISIHSIEEAKSLATVGTVTSWFSDQYLREQGFTNLVSDGDPAVMAEKLMKGQVDAFVCSSVAFPSILKNLGYSLSDVNATFSLMSSDYYIAFSKTTPSTIVNKWQTTLNSLKADGTYNAINQKWFH